VALRPDETAGSLQERLAPLGAELLLETLDGLRQGSLVAVPQDDRLASQAPLLRKEDGWVDFARPAMEVDCWIRGMDPWPGAFCALGDERIKLFRSRVVTDGGAPGEVLACDDRGLLVACGEGAVWIAELQRPGRRRLAARDLAVGRAIPAGARLGAHSGP
jgi:methionyl-tRNA formyltransferase